MISSSKNALAIALLALAASPGWAFDEAALDAETSHEGSQFQVPEEVTQERAPRAKAEDEVAALREQVKDLKLRIRAGDAAGRVLEEQLAESVRNQPDRAELQARLAEARELAEREHLRAEQISAQVLEQVEAQRAIGRELQRMIVEAKRERQDLLAKLKQQPQPDVESRKRLVEANEKLAESLKEAWAKAKLSDELQEEARAAARTIADQREELKKLEALTRRQDAMEASLAKLRATEQSLEEMKKKDELQKAAREDLKASLESTLAEQQRLEDQIKKLQAENSSLNEKANFQRAEALRERILRKRVELQIEDEVAERARARAAVEDAASKSAEAALLEIAPIYFGKNQADSEAQERSLLAQIAEIHQRFPGARFRISGHTCTDGNAAGNLALSQRRAQRIAELLKNNGIPAAAIAGVVGKGEASPIADNNTQQGREANRRVEIEVLRE